MQQAAEVKVGIFVVVVVALGVFIASSLKGGLGRGARTYDFEIWFDSAPGVGKGSPARLAGVDIGEIVDKDIIQVSESVTFAPTSGQNPPLEQVKTWTAGRPGDRNYVALVVDRRSASVDESSRLREASRPRSVARLVVRVKRQYELYTLFRYDITGGVVFGDKQLSISDIGPDGMPLSSTARGRSILEARQRGERVAVLGGGPPSIDQIVGNVQKTIDEDTVARVKRIVAHVEETTNQAQQLVSAMRATVQANQGNADRMMGNVAAASEDLKNMLAQARVQANQTLENVNRLSATARRITEGNEGKINRITANLSDASGSFARLARDNEGRIGTTLGDVSAIAREVRGMIAANRENIDTIAANLAATSGDVRSLTGSSRKQLEGILENVNTTVAKVRDVLDQSDARLKGIIEDTHAMVGDARATMGTLRESIDPITANLRETSQNLNTASRNAAALTGDPSTKQILANVERTTAEARELVGDLRSLTADPKVQEDVRTTAHNLRSASDKLDQTLGGISSFKPLAFADVYYLPQTSRWQSDVNVAVLGKSKTSFHFGMDDVTNRPRLNFQLGRTLGIPDLRVRYGFYRGKLGLGADYTPMRNGRLRTDFYDFNHGLFNAKFAYRTPFGLTGLIGVEDMFHRFDWTIGVQLGRDR